MNRTYKIIATLISILLALPIGVWFFFKPIRVIAPELNGLTCAGAICVEDLATLSRAEELHKNAMDNIASKLHPLSSPPRAIFCSTQKCYQSFGGKGRGSAVFNLAVVIPPESWQIYIVEHELIHMLQAQELGLLGREKTPMWFKEGMPFFISNPPVTDLPDYAKPLVEQYKDWERRVGRENIWSKIHEYR